jgi:hypothetical protein
VGSLGTALAASDTALEMNLVEKRPCNCVKTTAHQSQTLKGSLAILVRVWLFDVFANLEKQLIR